MAVDTFHKCLSYIFLCLLGVLTVSNYMKSAENSLILKELKSRKESFDDAHQRTRRQAPTSVKEEAQPDERQTPDVFFDTSKLSSFVVETANKTFQKEIQKVLETLILNFPVSKLCKSVLKTCKVEQGDTDNNRQRSYTNILLGKRGPPGPRGPSGPRGPPGKRGLGLYPPELKEYKLKITANISDDKTFECTFFGNPIPNVQWKSNARHINITAVTDKESSQITSRLHVKNISWSDRGSVSCIATTVLGQDRKSGALNVLAPPIITLSIGPLFTNIGVNVKFPECRVRSFPPAQITWSRVYWKLPKSRHSVDGGILNISRVRIEDEGFYICTAKNYLGEATSSIQLKTKPLEFKDRPPYVINAVNTTTLTCSAYGFPNQMKGSFYTIYGNKIASKVSSSEGLFTISAVVTTSGRYTCEIQYENSKIEFITMVEMFTLQSEILNKAQTGVLGNWLRGTKTYGKYELCYRSSRDGESVSTFHSRCDNKPGTIVIMKPRYSSDKIVGGYTDLPWKTTRYHETSYGSSNNTFIFDLKTSTKYHTKNNGVDAVCWNTSYGPCFGRLELYVTCCKLHFYLKSGNVYGYGRSSNTRVSNIEVFYKV